jgi:hypothetical protein
MKQANQDIDSHSASSRSRRCRRTCQQRGSWLAGVRRCPHGSLCVANDRRRPSGCEAIIHKVQQIVTNRERRASVRASAQCAGSAQTPWQTDTSALWPPVWRTIGKNELSTINANYNATYQAQGDVGQVSVQKTVDRVLAVTVNEIGIAARTRHKNPTALTPAVNRRGESEHNIGLLDEHVQVRGCEVQKGFHVVVKHPALALIVHAVSKHL